jgi:hypothetical protein
MMGRDFAGEVKMEVGASAAPRDRFPGMSFACEGVMGLIVVAEYDHRLHYAKRFFGNGFEKKLRRGCGRLQARTLVACSISGHSTRCPFPICVPVSPQLVTYPLRKGADQLNHPFYG